MPDIITADQPSSTRGINDDLTEWCEKKPDLKTFKWQNFPRIAQPGKLSPEACGWRSPQGFWLIPSSASTDCEPAYDFTDLNACAKFEALLLLRGLWGQWIRQLYCVIRDTGATMKDWGDGFTKGDRPKGGPIQFDGYMNWLYATATAPQRCAALKKVMEESDG